MKGFGRLVRRGEQRILVPVAVISIPIVVSYSLPRRPRLHKAVILSLVSCHQILQPFLHHKPQNSPFFAGQRRTMFIQTQSTPNPSSLMFYPGKAMMEVGSADFPNARLAMNSPLAKSLYGVDGITRVFFGSDFVTVTKSEDVSWNGLKPEIFAAIMDFYSSGNPLFMDSNSAAPMDTAIHEGKAQGFIAGVQSIADLL